MVEAKEQQNGGAHHGEQHSSPSLRVQLIQQYSYMLMWIVLSASVILVNKYVLSFAGFPYPVALTCLHMLFCATLSHGLVRLGLAEATPITPDTYISCILPIGLLFAGVLWTGNAAYLYLSVSFIQMLKASMPMIVYVIGVLFTTEVWTMTTGLNMVVVATGIAIASYGELLFDRTGVMLQVISVVAESVRLCLIQILLQRRGIKLNPIATLYHIAPCCFVFLALPFTYMELPRMMADENLVLDARMISLLLLSASIAFALNMAVFLLIGKTSALTMNVAGVCKDWLLILLSVVLYGSPVTSTQLFGYGLAFLGVMYYNWRKVQAMKASQAKPQAPLAADNEKGKR